MDDVLSIRPIARINNDYAGKFGVPRQSGLVNEVLSYVVFEPEFRSGNAIRGLESFTHLWLIWGFSCTAGAGWSETVRPPRLGGNKRMGVFATRSTYRPNPLALSSVELKRIVKTREYGIILKIAGADMVNGTPIYDIKPYLGYTDCHPEACGGYTDELESFEVEVNIPKELMELVPEEKREPLKAVLRHDPRPSYHNDPEREYGMAFGGLNVKFRVEDGVLKVTAVESI